jgi:predicted peptidase
MFPSKRLPVTRASGPCGLRRNATLSLVCLVVATLFFCTLNLHADTAPAAPAPATQPANPLANDDANRNIVLPTEPGDHKLKFRTHIGDKAVTLSYLLHLPPDYADPRKKHPMLVFFHGIGECGTDLAGVYGLGPMSLIKEGGNPTFAASCPFIVLCPQCPPHGETWDTDFIYKAAAQLVEQTVRKTRCDVDRVYATGLSMGGLGSWCVAEQSPDLFAAIAPLAAMHWQPERTGDLLKYVAVWCVVGAQDQPRFVDGTREMDAALRNSSLPRRFDYYVDNGHDAWAYPFQNPQFYEWMLSQRRPSPAMKKKLDAQKKPPATQPMPNTPGHYLREFPIQIGNQPFHMDYVLYLPREYSPTGPRLPAMLFLHEQDTIGPDFHDICMHGPDLALERKPALQNNFPMVVISPRLPVKCSWDSDGMNAALLALLDHVSQSVRIDPDRITLAGINAGATGGWKLATEKPGRFSAILPVITDGTLEPGDDKASVLSNLPGRVFIRSDIGSSIDRMNQLIAKTRTDWRLTRLPKDATALGDLPAWSDHQIVNWLVQQHRKAANP